VGSTLAVAAVGTGSGFSWAGTGVAIAATIGAGAALTVVGAGIGAAVGNAPAALTGTYLVLLVAINILNGAKPGWGKHVDPLSAVFDLVEGDAAARPIAVLTAWVLTTAIAGIVVTRRRTIS
jgi:ABC-2 type transport system permease protein